MISWTHHCLASAFDKESACPALAVHSIVKEDEIFLDEFRILEFSSDGYAGGEVGQ